MPSNRAWCDAISLQQVSFTSGLTIVGRAPFSLIVHPIAGSCFIPRALCSATREALVISKHQALLCCNRANFIGPILVCRAAEFAHCLAPADLLWLYNVDWTAAPPGPGSKKQRNNSKR
jgi:hypothetical protein